MRRLLLVMAMVMALAVVGIVPALAQPGPPPEVALIESMGPTGGASGAEETGHAGMAVILKPGIDIWAIEGDGLNATATYTLVNSTVCGTNVVGEFTTDSAGFGGFAGKTFEKGPNDVSLCRGGVIRLAGELHEASDSLPPSSPGPPFRP